jgi:hypothetical protein
MPLIQDILNGRLNVIAWLNIKKKAGQGSIHANPTISQQQFGGQSKNYILFIAPFS